MLEFTSELFNFTNVLLFFLVAVVFVFVTLTISKIASRLFGTHKPNDEKLSTYECGERPVGSPWIRFHVRFYVIALIFIIFDVEAIVLYPWAVEYRSQLSELGWVALVDMLIFVGILILGLAYVWKKGDIEWVRSYDKDIRKEKA